MEEDLVGAAPGRGTKANPEGLSLQKVTKKRLIS